MFLTGFADEAGTALDTQIKATKELGWKYIESRTIGNTNLGRMSDAEFDEVCAKLDASGIKINCYGSAVANWGASALNPEDVEKSRTELLTAIPRMQKLGIKMIRAMSFKMQNDREPDAPEVEEAVFRSVNEFVHICEDAGIMYGHENCMNYGGLSYLHTLKLLDHVKSPNFTLIFDTGNPVFNYRHIGSKPYPLQSSWEFYRQVREFVSYVHIKDGTAIPGNDMTKQPPCEFCYAGDGCGDIRAIVKDLLKNGYDGGFSIEPHVASVFHEKAPETDMAEVKYTSYIRYGKLFEKLLQDCCWKIK